MGNRFAPGQWGDIMNTSLLFRTLQDEPQNERAIRGLADDNYRESGFIELNDNRVL
jgi:hypothetical protein